MGSTADCLDSNHGPTTCKLETWGTQGSLLKLLEDEMGYRKHVEHIAWPTESMHECIIVVVETQCGESNDGSRGSIMKDLEHQIKVFVLSSGNGGHRDV